MRLLMLLSATVLLHAHSARAQAKPRACSVDSGAVAGRFTGEAFRDCDVDRPAKRRRQKEPSFKFPRDLHCVRATLLFVVDTSGVPEAESAIVVESDNELYAASLIKTLDKWLYEPAKRDGKAVRQIVRERRALSDGKVPFVVARDRALLPPVEPCE